MADILVLAEKPSVASDLCKAMASNSSRGAGFSSATVGNDRIYFASAVGHLMELVDPSHYNPDLKAWALDFLPFEIPGWTFVYQPKEWDGRGVNYFKVVSQLMRELPPGSEIVNCCDAGREGELIFRSIFDTIVKDPKRFKWSRMWVESMTPEALVTCFKNRKPLSDRDGLGRAAYARAYADQYLGYCITRLATVGAPRGHFPEKKAKRCGRVKSPVIGFVVERDKAIANFKPEEIYSVRGFFPSIGGRKTPFVLADLKPFFDDRRAEVLGRSKLDPDDDRKFFWDFGKAQNFVMACGEKGLTFAVSDEGKDSPEAPPPGFDLTGAQKEAFNRFGFPATKTLEILQRLYEQRKVLTYPRTDFKHFPTDYSTKLPASLQAVLHRLNRQEWRDQVLDQVRMSQSKAFDDSKVGDHFALSPNDNVAGLDGIDGDDLTIYLMVVERCLQALDEPAIYDVLTRTWVKAPEAAMPYQPITFKTTAKQLKKAGWRRWTGAVVSEEGEDISPLAPLQGAHEQALKFEVHSSKTTAPKPFNEATLLGAMETAANRVTCSVLDEGLDVASLVGAMKEKGLGTPATRGPLIEELVRDDYFKRSGSGKAAKLTGTPMAHQLYDELMLRSPFIVSPAVTAEWEKMLFAMEENKGLTIPQFMDKLKEAVQKAKEGFIKAGVPPTAFRKAKAVAQASGFICPKAAKPWEDFGEFWRSPYPAWNVFRLAKVFIGRPMTPEEWVLVLEGIDSKKPHTLTGLHKKAGGTFAAKIVKENHPKWGPGFGFQF